MGQPNPGNLKTGQKNEKQHLDILKGSSDRGWPKQRPVGLTAQSGSDPILSRFITTLSQNRGSEWLNRTV